MSRAFVKEDDANKPPETLPDIAVPPLPNPVTARGLRLIEDAVRDLETRLHTPDLHDAEQPDPAEMADLRRRLRYWTARRRTAQLTHPPTDAEEVGFGSQVVVDWPGRGRVAMHIVGEDEADPAEGRVSWRAPTVAALIGNGKGDRVEATIGGKPMALTIVAVDNTARG